MDKDDDIDNIKMRLTTIETYIQELKVDRAVERIHYEHISSELADIKDIIKGHNNVVRNAVLGAGGIIGTAVVAWIIQGGLTR